MKPVELLEILHTAERLKDVTRHSYTSGGRHESVGGAQLAHHADGVSAAGRIPGAGYG